MAYINSLGDIEYAYPERDEIGIRPCIYVDTRKARRLALKVGVNSWHHLWDVDEYLDEIENAESCYREFQWEQQWKSVCDYITEKNLWQIFHTRHGLSHLKSKSALANVYILNIRTICILIR